MTLVTNSPVVLTAVTSNGNFMTNIVGYLEEIAELLDENQTLNSLLDDLVEEYDELTTEYETLEQVNAKLLRSISAFKANATRRANARTESATQA
jgi:Zn-dependent M32 family carboxypeptidase